MVDNLYKRVLGHLFGKLLKTKELMIGVTIGDAGPSSIDLIVKGPDVLGLGISRALYSCAIVRVCAGLGIELWASPRQSLY